MLEPNCLALGNLYTFLNGKVHRLVTEKSPTSNGDHNLDAPLHSLICFNMWWTNGVKTVIMQGLFAGDLFSYVEQRQTFDYHIKSLEWEARVTFQITTQLSAIESHSRHIQPLRNPPNRVFRLSTHTFPWLTQRARLPVWRRPVLPSWPWKSPASRWPSLLCRGTQRCCAPAPGGHLHSSCMIWRGYPFRTNLMKFRVWMPYHSSGKS